MTKDAPIMATETQEATWHQQMKRIPRQAAVSATEIGSWVRTGCVLVCEAADRLIKRVSTLGVVRIVLVRLHVLRAPFD